MLLHEALLVVASLKRPYRVPRYGVRSDNALKVRFSATLGEELEVEVELL